MGFVYGLPICGLLSVFFLGYFLYAILYRVVRNIVLCIIHRIQICTVKPMPSDIPPEILAEILLRLPLKSLVRFTSVSKAWNSLITDRAFIFDHLNRTTQASNEENSSILRIQTYGPNVGVLHPLATYEEFYSLFSYTKQINQCTLVRSSLPHLFVNTNYKMLVGACHGLVCVHMRSNIIDTRFIWNPSIRKYKVLNMPYVSRWYGWCSSHLLGFGFDSKNTDYKVVRVAILDHQKDVDAVLVYSLASASWRSITARIPLHLSSYKSLSVKQVFLNGHINWIFPGACGDDGKRQNFIISFDVVEEIFGAINLPQHLRESTFVPSILEGGQYLSVLHCTSSFPRLFSVWVMKEYGVVESWNEVWRSNSYGGISEVLAEGHNRKVVLKLLNKAVILADDPMIELVKPRYAKYIEANVASYVESLVFINKEHDVMYY